MCILEKEYILSGMDLICIAKNFYVETGIRQGIEQGIEQGKEDGLKSLVKILKKFMSDIDTIYKTVIEDENFSDVTYEQVKKYYDSEQ